MDERAEKVLMLWKKIASGDTELKDLDIEDLRGRVEKADEFADAFIANPTKAGFLKLWNTGVIASAQGDSSGSKIYKNWRENGRDMKELSGLIKSVKESEVYDERWEEEIGTREPMRELYGLLHMEDHPLIYSTTEKGLRTFGYGTTGEYQRLEEEFGEFKKEYIRIIGSVTEERDNELPIHLEIHRLFQISEQVCLKDLREIEDEELRQFVKEVLVLKMLSNSLSDGISRYARLYNEGKFHEEEEYWESWKFEHADYYEENVKSRFNLTDLNPDDLEMFFEAIEGDRLPNVIPAYLLGARWGSIGWVDFKNISLENPEASAMVMSSLMDENEGLEGRLSKFVEFYKDISLSPGPTLGLATYFLMFTYPDEYIFYKYDEFTKFFKDFLDDKVSSGFNPKEYIAINEICKELKVELSKHSTPSSMIHVHNMIYTHRYLSKKDKNLIDTELSDDLNIWQMSPGRHQDDFWPIFVEEGITAIGWEDGTDLKGMSKEDIARFMGRSPVDNDVVCYYDFANEMRIGDIIVAKKGSSKEIYGIGVVKGEYSYEPERGEKLFAHKGRGYYSHIREVEWILDFVEMFGERLVVDADVNFVLYTLNTLEKERYEELRGKIIQKYPELEELFDEIEVLTENLSEGVEEVDFVTEKQLDEILGEIFANQKQADEAREYFSKTFEYLGTPEEYKDIIATTYSAGKNRIAIDYGIWLIFSVSKIREQFITLLAVDMSLLPEDYNDWPDVVRKTQGSFAADERVGLLGVKWDPELFERRPELKRSWISALKIARDIFKDWKGTPYKRYHREYLYRWMTGESDEIEARVDTNYFWVTANPKIWKVSNIEDGGTVFYSAYNTKGNKSRIFEDFEKAKLGDKVIFYESTPVKKVIAEGEITEGMHKQKEEGFDEPVEGITIIYKKPINKISWADLVEIPELEESKPIKNGARGSIFELTEKEYETILALEPEDTLVSKPNENLLLEKNKVKLKFPNFDVTKGLYFPPDMRDEINHSLRAALGSGKNIILTGPPGTGKTKIAKKTVEFMKEKCDDCVDGFIFTTATADWTTFDTIGGYHPEREGKSLAFKPGLFLRCFRNREGVPVNNWLIIDEINRADIDKAFGQLFSVLSKDDVELPFTTDEGDAIRVISMEDGLDNYSDNDYYVTRNWRLLATMNTYDKASLYEMSYAFMRRFAFVDVSVPTDEITERLLEKYIEVWEEIELDKVNSSLGTIKGIWSAMNEGKRAIGPAIIRDILLFIQESNDGKIVPALKLYVLPQLEGMVRADQADIINGILKHIDDADEKESLKRVSKERFELREGDFKESK